MQNKLRKIWYLVLAGCLLTACASAGSSPKGAEQGTAQPTAQAGVALEWSREGGIAGFCDQLSIQKTGEAMATDCKSGSPVEAGTVRLDAAQLSLLLDKMEKLKAFEWEQSDTAVADAMTTKLHFYGNGSEEASQADKQALLDLAGSVFSAIK